MAFLRLLSLLLPLLTVPEGAAARRAPGNDQPAVAEPQPSTYYQDGRRHPIWPGDVLSVWVFGRPELSQDVHVDRRGFIRLAQLDGDVQTACFTLDELQRELLSRYKGSSDDKYWS